MVGNATRYLSRECCIVLSVLVLPRSRIRKKTQKFGRYLMLSPVVTLSIFQKQPDPQTFSTGEVIFKEGQPGNCMFGILEGEVEILVNGKTVEIIESGEVFGTGILLGIEARTYTAIAKTDCKLAYLDESGFLFAVQETPVFAIKVMKSYSERLSRLQHKL